MLRYIDQLNRIDSRNTFTGVWWADFQEGCQSGSMGKGKPFTNSTGIVHSYRQKKELYTMYKN